LTGEQTTLIDSLMGRSKFGEIWVRDGKITRDQLEDALREQRRTSERLGEILIARGLITARDVDEARAHQMDVPFCDVAHANVDPQAVALVPPHIARSYSLLPIDVIAGRLRVAMINPADLEPLDLLQRTTRLRPEPMLAEAQALAAAIEANYGAVATAVESDSLDSMIDDIAVERTPEESEAGSGDVRDLIQASEQAPVIKMVNMLLTEAVRARASDIHLEPRRNALEVRHRVDGVLRKVRVLPKALQAPCISRLKIMAELDISEKRLPQDGRIPLTVEGRSLDLRVSTLPIHYGERVVMRVLDKSASIRGLSELDLSPTNQSRFEALIRRSFGIILVIGPTGSGKTTTLYSALNALAGEETNIVTCEDPIEYDIDKINQSAVNERAGLTFARQLRAILRQDPDVVLVGEIRDVETAEIAFRAALTGHLVLSTLHANDAPSAVTRLLDMGVPNFLIASALIGVVAQRLSRRLCTSCRGQFLPTEAQVAALGFRADEPIWHAPGCSACDEKGYKGRVAVHEVMTTDEEFSRLIMAQASGSNLRQAAVASGMISIREDAIGKVRSGLTSCDEVTRLLSFREE